MSKKKNKVESKKFTLATNEIQHLRAIEGVKEYLRNLIDADMNGFVNSVIKTRLSINQEVNVTVDLQKAELEIIEKTDKEVVDEVIEAIKPENVKE